MKQTKENRQDLTHTAFDNAATTWQGYLSDRGLCAIYVSDEKAEDGQMFYIHKDYLGSYETISNETGTAIEKLNFDPWGRRRSPSNGSMTEDASSFLFDRGFTGHEHLDAFGLINMNGRMYDPLLGRFLSPDNYVQAPELTQNLNRYSYCLNNPLIYTDPSGDFIFTALAVLTGQIWALPITIGADFGALSGGIRGAQDPDVGFWKGAGRGAIVGGVGGGLSMIGGAGMPFATNLLLGTAEGAITGGLDAALWGNEVGKGMLWGAAGGAAFTTLTSENFRNALKGQGFYNNESVFNSMMERGMDKQGIIDYFGFEGKYNPRLKSKNYQASDYWGATNSKTGQISYGNLAFENYPTLKGTYIKESFHSRKVLNGLSLEQLPEDLQGLGMDTYLEEMHGYVHMYKNQGLFIGHNMPIGGVKFYQSQLSLFGVSYPTYPSAFQWIYKIPRRW